MFSYYDCLLNHHSRHRELLRQAEQQRILRQVVEASPEDLTGGSSGQTRRLGPLSDARTRALRPAEQS
jgi:hypothetical protein